MQGYMIPIGLGVFGMLWGAVGAGFILYGRMTRPKQHQVAAREPGPERAPA
jgi:hypothetical protein